MASLTLESGPTTTAEHPPQPKAHSRPTSSSLWLVRVVLMSFLATLTHAQIYLGCYALDLTPVTITTTTSAAMTMAAPLPGHELIQESKASHLRSLQSVSSVFQDMYMSRGLCTEHCQSLQLTYAVLEGGQRCACFNEPPPEQARVDDALCDTSCAGYPLETCGSSSTPAELELEEQEEGAKGEERGGSAHGSVLLVSHSISAAPAPAVSEEQQHAEGQKTSGLVEGGVVATAPPGEGGSMVESVTVAATGVQDREGQGSAGELVGTVMKDEKRHTDEEIEGEEEDDSEEEEEESEGEEDEKEKEDDSDHTAKAPADGHEAALALSGIPVASTVVGTVCLLGICAFFIYLTRKRQRERVRAAWVDSVFGAHHGQGGNDPRRPYSYSRYGTSYDYGNRRSMVYHHNHSSSSSHSSINNNNHSRLNTAERKIKQHKKQQKQQKQQRPALEDLESVSDAQSEDTLDFRRPSTHHISNGGVQQQLRNSHIVEVGGGGAGGGGGDDTSYSRAVRATVMLPATAAGRSGRMAYKSMSASRPPLPSPMEYTSHLYTGGGGSGVHAHAGNNGGMLYSTRPSPPLPQHQQQQQQQQQQSYEEFLDQDECEVDAELAHLPDEYAVLQQQPMASVVTGSAPPVVVQRPAYVAYAHPYSHYRYSQSHPHPQHLPQQQQQQPQHYPHPHLHPQPQQQQQQRRRSSSYACPQSDTAIHPLQHSDPATSAYSLNPFRDTFPHPSSLLIQPRHPPLQRHSLDSSTGRLFSTMTSTFGRDGHSPSARPKRPALSDYRRPHSFTLGENSGHDHHSHSGHHQHLLDPRMKDRGGGGGGDVGIEENEYRIPLHVLDEDHDLVSVTDSEPMTETAAAAVSLPSSTTTTMRDNNNNNSHRGTFSGSLRQKLKRLSTPYVQAIRHQQQQHEQQLQQRQQQQHSTTGGPFSCGDESGGGGGVENGFEASGPAPGQAPASEQRRWSRVLLKNGHQQQQKQQQHRHHHPYRNGRGYEEQFAETEEGPTGAATTRTRTTMWKHRQVHSGSLASFRGLDDPSLPRLRVMNPDDGPA
ncbi:unnamed protein product [Mortierella alpina]